MSSLQEVRDKVRAQADLDAADLPDSTLDGFIREAFDRTFATERKWPFFEYTWTLPLTAGQTELTLPTNPEVAFINRLVDTTSDVVLTQIDQADAEDLFVASSAQAIPLLFSTWGTTLALWPQPTASARTYRMRGYRKPMWSGVAANELDGDSRLHLAIFHYAASLVYAQLEDAELEQLYMQRWSQLVQAIRRDIMRPDFHEPMILNGGGPTATSTVTFWNVNS